MLNNIDWRGMLFLDVETVPQQPDYSGLDDLRRELWDKKMRSTSEREGKTPEELYDRAGIYAEFGKIVCISAAYFADGTFNEKSFYGHDERKLLEEFSSFLSKPKSDANSEFFITSMCAHNGKEFDYPYIARRCLINSLPIPPLLDNAGKKPWEVNLIDTMELWKFGDYKSYTSLELLVTCFGIPTPKDKMEGKDVWKVYWIENNVEKIKEYCEKDVRAVAGLFLKFKYPDKQITIDQILSNNKTDKGENQQ